MNKKYILPKSKLILCIIISSALAIFLFATLVRISVGIIKTIKYEKIESTVDMVVDKSDARYIRVKYNVNDKEYTLTIQNAFNNYEIGDLVTIYYNKNNPKNTIIPLKYFTVHIIIFIISLCIFIIFFSTLFKYIKENKRINLLLNNGKIIKTEIIDIIKDGKHIVSNIAPLVITSIYKDEFTSNEYKSKFIYFDLNNYNDLKSYKILCYIDKTNPDNYYIDINTIEK